MRNFVLGFALAAAICAAVGVAYAAIPDSNGVITGCAGNIGGYVRLIDTEKNQSCTFLEKQVEFGAAQTSTDRLCPEGTFMRGIAADGSLICTGFYIVASPNTLTDATVECDTGDIATGGGFTGIDIIGSTPGNFIVGDEPGTWRVTAGNPGITPVVICADVAEPHRANP